MTSTLPSTARASRRSSTEVARDLTTRRPLVLVATVGGLAAAASTLVVCLALGLTGWYLADGGAHGTPRDGLRIGALGWLLAHRSGVVVQGTPVMAVPLGLTLVVAWAVWRTARRVGEAVASHGPDAQALADGARDWTVPLATGLFTTGYLLVAVLTAALAGGPDTAPSTTRVVECSLALCLVAGLGGIAVGSGRAAVRTALLPAGLRVAVRIARAVSLLWLAVALLAFVAALATGATTAANIMSQSHLDGGSAASVVLVNLLLTPNATAFSGAYLLGPGFAVGAGTLVAPSGAVLGPLPLYAPILAALPDPGRAPGWTAALVAVPPIVALVATVLVLRRVPTLRWEDGAVRGLAGGVLAAVAFAVLAHLAAGSVGPGRMQHVTPLVGPVLWHAVLGFGLGGLVGGLGTTLWQRRRVARTEA